MMVGQTHDTCRHCGSELRIVNQSRARRVSDGRWAVWHWYGGFVCTSQCNRGVWSSMRAENVSGSDDARMSAATDALLDELNGDR